MEVEWTEPAIGDMSALDRAVAQRVKRAVERFAVGGAGDVKRLQGMNPPVFRLRVGDYRVRFRFGGGTVLVLRVLNRREAYR